jgi:hypothetical protein
MRSDTFLPMLALSAVLLAGCGDEESESSDRDAVAENTCTEPGTVCANLLVPADYAGQPRQIVVGFYRSLPPAGPPTAPEFIDSPALEPGKPFPLKFSTTATGELYLYVVVYDQQNPTVQPVAGVDFAAHTEKKMNVGPQPVNAGDLPLERYTAR